MNQSFSKIKIYPTKDLILAGFTVTVMSCDIIFYIVLSSLKMVTFILTCVYAYGSAPININHSLIVHTDDGQKHFQIRLTSQTNAHLFVVNLKYTSHHVTTNINSS